MQTKRMGQSYKPSTKAMGESKSHSVHKYIIHELIKRIKSHVDSK